MLNVKWESCDFCDDAKSMCENNMIPYACTAIYIYILCIYKIKLNKYKYKYKYKYIYIYTYIHTYIYIYILNNFEDSGSVGTRWHSARQSHFGHLRGPSKSSCGCRTVQNHTLGHLRGPPQIKLSALKNHGSLGIHRVWGPDIDFYKGFNRVWWVISIFIRVLIVFWGTRLKWCRKSSAIYSKGTIMQQILLNVTVTRVFRACHCDV